MKRELALFAGAGGGLLGGHLLGWRPVCLVEFADYPRAVLKARQRDGHLPADCVLARDVFKFDGRPWRGRVDILTGGFPCQPFSTAGQNLAERDARNGWPHTLRIVREVRPREVFFENVAGLIGRHSAYFKRIIREISALGYCVAWRCVSAQQVGAPHKRDRVWILGRFVSHANEVAAPCRSQPIKQRCVLKVDSSRANYAQGGACDGALSGARPRGFATTWWAVDPADAQPRVGRVVDGVAHGVDRFAALGNGQVPAVVAAAYVHLSRQLDAFEARLSRQRGAA